MNYDKKKFKNAVVFLAKNGGWDVGKKKLAKLLYFIDFTLYELRKKSLTEMPYAKMDYGPMPEPKTFYAALGDLQKTGVINIEERNSVGLERIVTQEKVDMDVFDEEELKVMNQVVEKYRAESAGNLEKIAQSEPPYKMVEYGEQIPYYLSFYRNSFGEMDIDYTSSDTRRNI